jgi:hypothetical protein
MWKYIVYWTLVKLVPTSCPALPVQDEFGRESFNYGGSCAVAHYKTEYWENQRVFMDRDSAFALYHRALKEQPDSVKFYGSENGYYYGMFQQHGDLINIEIDSLKIEK